MNIQDKQFEIEIENKHVKSSPFRHLCSPAELSARTPVWYSGLKNKIFIEYRVENIKLYINSLKTKIGARPPPNILKFV